MKKIEGYLFDPERYYTKDHIWASVEDGNVRAGMDDYGVKGLGNVEYIELPRVGDRFKQGEAFGTVESEKWIGELTMPVGGEIIEVNSEVEDDYELLTDSPYERGWLILINPDDLERDLNSGFLIYGEEAIKEWMKEEISKEE